MDLMHAVLELPYETRMLVVALFWCWWTERNKANHAERRFTPEEMQFNVRRYIAEWDEFFRKRKPPSQPGVHQWQRPPLDWITINIDGTFHVDSGRGGWGCLARDHTGDPLFAAAGSFHNAGEALRTETQALLQAISLAEQASIGRPIFATDCQVLQSAITTNNYDAAPLGALFREVKFLLQVSFIAFHVRPRRCHEIGRASCRERVYVLV